MVLLKSRISDHSWAAVAWLPVSIFFSRTALEDTHNAHLSALKANAKAASPPKKKIICALSVNLRAIVWNPRLSWKPSLNGNESNRRNLWRTCQELHPSLTSLWHNTSAAAWTVGVLYLATKMYHASSISSESTAATKPVSLINVQMIAFCSNWIKWL